MAGSHFHGEGRRKAVQTKQIIFSVKAGKVTVRHTFATWWVSS